MFMDELPRRENSPTPWIMTSNSQDQDTSSDCIPKRKACRYVAVVAGLSTLCFLLLGICVALSVMYANVSDPKPQWESPSSGYSNISKRHISANTIYNDLKKDNKVLKERSVWLENETKRLNDSLVELTAVNSAMNVESTKLQELQEETQQLKETNGLLRDELSETKEHNQELLRRVELQRQNQNQMEAELKSAKEALDAPGLHCPKVNQTTEARMSKKCRDDWKEFWTKCYYFSHEQLTWNSSRAWCQKEGADLVVINSEKEQMFVFVSSLTDPHQTGGRLWIGMTDEEEEGQWKWVDGSPVTSGVQYWFRRSETDAEPDNWTGEDPLGEDCGHIDTSTIFQQSWMDGSCKNHYRWICEMNI